MTSQTDWSDPGFGCAIPIVVVSFAICVTAYNIAVVLYDAVRLFAPAVEG